MNKYWKISIIIALTIMTIGAFYTHSAYSSTQLPQFHIKEERGNSELIKNVAISAFYMVDSHGEGVSIEQNKTTYDSEKSFFEQFNRDYARTDSTIKQLQKKYRNFMRGKLNISSFYEDKQLLAFADIDNNTGNGSRSFIFNISVLNKKTGNSTSFKYEIPSPEKYNHIYVEDVQYFGKELKVLTRSYQQNIGGQDVSKYIFDIPNEKLLSKEEVFAGSKTLLEYSLIPNIDPIQPSKYAVFSISEPVYEPEETEAPEPPKPKEKELVVYDLEQNKKLDTIFPKEIQKINTDAIQPYVDGSTAYFAEEADQKVKLTAFNLETGKIDNEITLPIDLKGKYNEMRVVVKDGKFYLLVKNHDMQTANVKIMIADIKTESIVFEGRLAADKNMRQSLRSLELYDIQIK
ncbi:hypothetical protein JOC77_002158 [Peribacillus deserti]|uniref:Transcriptional regulator n=1 Tax=Peribacillus deserti TaxID=673318 RepID=A0ABS2QI09_9BACI|nr:hypothetical protein [Peribacillus deserti]MBM7692727.1 hypothetical protein [Peribacillus deserti]